MPLAIWRALRARGVLGMNDRNGRFVLPLNPRKFYPRVDDKLLTKQLAEARGIAVPALLGVVSHYHELRHVPEMLAPHETFVLKPARGSQGNGIVVVVGRDGDLYRRPNGTTLTVAELQQHVSSILSGVFSLRGDWDNCLIEELVIVHPEFAKIVPRGVPDIRVIVCNGLPAMAMCRLPTEESNGRANLHQGAMAVGLDMASGRAVHAMHHNLTVDHHPDTKYPLQHFAVPHWDDVLGLAAAASEIAGLGYLGVDVVVDARHGPLLLELNARPGLAIQLANDEGLVPRLEIARDRGAASMPAEQRCALARELFARTPIGHTEEPAPE
mgnify:CR=1 FL=1